MQNETKTHASIAYVRDLLDGLIEAAGAQDHANFALRFEGVIKATADIGQVHSREMGIDRPVSGAVLAQETIAAASAAADNAISLETKRRLRKLGLNPKYAGIRSESDLFEMQLAEKEKGGS